MSNLSIFEPRLFEPALTEPLDTMFRRMMSPLRMELENGNAEMRVDISEADGHYKVKANLPGVKKEDVSVRVDGNIVQIDAEIKKEKDTKDTAGKVLRSERYHGYMSRAFTVAQDVDDSKAVCKLEDGVLTLDLPKKATSSSKRLAIQ